MSIIGPIGPTNPKPHIFSLRIPLVHESTEIRAATLRTLRHLTTTSEAAKAVTTLNIHYLISRCLDIELDNKIERLQALKICRNLALIQMGEFFPEILLRSLVSIAEEGKKEDDRFYRAALALLCEISVVNPLLFIDTGGVKVLTYCLLDTSMPKIAEAILSSLLRMHNDPKLRLQANVNLGKNLIFLALPFLTARKRREWWLKVTFFVFVVPVD